MFTIFISYALCSKTNYHSLVWAALCSYKYKLFLDGFYLTLKNTIRLFLTLFKIYPTIPTRDSQCRHITHTDTEPGRENDVQQWVRRHWSLETDWSDSLRSPPHRSATVEPPRRRGRESSFLNVLLANSMRNVSPGRLTGTWLGILNSLWVQSN